MPCRTTASTGRSPPAPQRPGRSGSAIPDDQVDNTLSPQDQRYLLGKDPLPDAFRNRGERRARELAQTASVPQLAVAEMEQWVGLQERPRGSNRVPALGRVAAQLGLSDWYQKMGWPWCAFTVFLAALKVGGQSAEAGLRQGKFNALYCPTILGEAQAGRWGMRVVAASQAARGDLVLFDWSPQGDPADHIGRLVRPPSAGVVATVDGNSGDESLSVVLRERLDEPGPGLRPRLLTRVYSPDLIRPVVPVCRGRISSGPSPDGRRLSA